MLDVHLLQRRDDRRAQGMTCHQFISVWIFLSRVQASCSAFLDAAMLQRSVKRSGHRPPSGMIEEMDRNASGGIVRDSSRPECVGRGSSTGLVYSAGTSACSSLRSPMHHAQQLSGSQLDVLFDRAQLLEL